MNDTDAFFYSLDRAKIQANLYLETGDYKYLDAIQDYLKAANIFVNNIKGDKTYERI